jgi:hypothetical protein
MIIGELGFKIKIKEEIMKKEFLTPDTLYLIGTYI